MITIPRSRLVEVTYTLRLTANGSIYVDVPVVLINFLSIDPPPMPGDGARLGNHAAVSVDGHGQIRNMGIASTSGHSHPNDGIYGPREGSAHSGDSFRGIARASSTTLHIDALLSAGRARAEEHGHSSDQDARTRHHNVHRPGSLYSDYTPEPTSSRSQLGTMTTSRSVPGGMREQYHNRSIDRRRAAAAVPFDPAAIGGATPARPKNPRVMSYLSVHSSELDQPLSDDEDQDEDDEIGKTLREAARREGRKMSLAALTRAAEREKADVMGSPSGERAVLSGGDSRSDMVTETAPNTSGAVDESADMSATTPKSKTLQILDQTPTATPAAVVAPLPSVPSINANEQPTTTPEVDVRSQIEMHTPLSDGLEQIDEVNEEASQVGDEESFNVESAYGGVRTDDKGAASRPESRDLDYVPASSRALQGYSEDLLQPIETLPELSLDDVLNGRKWSVDMRAQYSGDREVMAAGDEAESDDDDKPLALIAKASPRPELAATPKKQNASQLPEWRDQERTPTQPASTPMSPPFAYDASPTPSNTRLPLSPMESAVPAPQTPTKMYEQKHLTSSSSLGGTGLTSSTNRVPSRKGSALDPQALLRVADERDPPIIQRGGSRFGSFAASTSALSDQESELGQVTQAVKRNLSVKVPAERVQMDSRYADEDADGEADEEEQQSSRLPPLSPKGRTGTVGTRGYERVGGPRERGSPIRWAQNTLSANVSSVPAIAGPRSMGGPNKSGSYYLDARRRSSGISPRTNYVPTVGGAGEAMMRGPSANTPSALRNQVALQPPVSLDSTAREKTEEESTLPPLAPSVDGDSSSDGHALESPQLSDSHDVQHQRSPEKDHERVSHHAHQQLLQSMRNIASPTPKPLPSPDASRRDSRDAMGAGPKLDPEWVPGDHLLHTEVAFARTSFSIPAGPASDDTHSHGHTVTSHHSHSSSFPSHNSSRQNSDGLSPLRPSHAHAYGTQSSHRSGHGHGHRATSPTPTAASVRSMKSAHSSHSVVLSGMQYKLQHMHARDEALRKFSVASAASSGRRESMLGDVEVPTSPQSQTQTQSFGYGAYPTPYGSARLGSTGGQSMPGERMIKPRKSYTTALGPRS